MVLFLPDARGLLDQTDQPQYEAEMTTSRWALVSLVTAAVIHGLIHAYSVFLSPLNEEMRLFFGSNAISAVTAFKTSYLVVYAASNLLFGMLTNRISARVTLAAGLLVNGAAVMAFALVAPSGIRLMHVFWIVAALGGGVYHPVANVLITRLYPHRKGWALGITGIGASIGFAFSPLLTTLLTGVFGLTWQPIAAIFGAVGVVASMAAFFTIRDPQRLPGKRFRLDTTAVRHTSGNESFAGWAFVIAIIAISGTRELAMWSTQDISDFFLLRVLGHSGTTGFFLFLLYAPGIFIQPLVGTLSDRINRTALFRAAFVTYGAAIISVPLVPAALIWFSYLVMGISQSAASVTGEAVIAGETTEANRGAVFGVFFTAGIGLGSMGPVLSGGLADLLGGTFSAFRTVFLILGAAVLLAGTAVPAAMRLARKQGRVAAQ